MSSTWTYTGIGESEADVPQEWVWERLRLRRDALLAASDFRMVADAPWSQEAWRLYRQALRDLPVNTIDPRTGPWPAEPTD